MRWLRLYPHTKTELGSVWLPNCSTWTRLGLSRYRRRAFLRLELGRRLCHHPHGPEVIGQIGIRQIAIAEREIPAHTPIGSPGIPDQKTLGTVIIAGRQHRVASQHFLVRRGHGRHAGFGYLVAFKALIYCESKNERITGSQTSLHLIEHLRDPLVLKSFPERSVGICRRRRFFGKLRDVIGPIGLGTCADVANCLYAVANLRPAIGADGVFHGSFVIVDEESRRREFPQALLDLFKL